MKKQQSLNLIYIYIQKIIVVVYKKKLQNIILIDLRARERDENFIIEDLHGEREFELIIII